VSLPATAVAPPTASSPGGGRVIGLPPGVVPPEVLVVDDDPVNRRMLTELLQAVGLPVLEAADGTTALTLFQQRRPAAVLLDLRLPDIQGDEVLQRLQQPGEASPAVIMLTAHATPHERDRLCRLGARELITKPFRESVLLQVLGEQLELNWQREDQAPGPLEIPALDRALLAAQPPAWREALARAAEALDGGAVEALLSELPAGAETLGSALRARLRNFDFDEISEALDNDD